MANPVVNYRYYRWKVLLNYNTTYGELRLYGFQLLWKGSPITPLSASAEPGVITDPSFPVSNVIDGTPTTFWRVTGHTTPAYNASWGWPTYVTIDMGAPTKADAYRVGWGPAEYVTQYYYRPWYDPRCWEVYGSNDNSTWTLLDEAHGQLSITQVYYTMGSRNEWSKPMLFDGIVTHPGYTTVNNVALPRNWSDWVDVETDTERWEYRRVLAQTAERKYIRVSSTRPYTGTAGQFADMGPTDFQLSSSRYLHMQSNYFLGGYYGGGMPKQDRMWEYMTDVTEPFPTLNGTGEAFNWYDDNTTVASLGTGYTRELNTVYPYNNPPLYSDVVQNPNGYRTWMAFVGAGFYWNDEPCSGIFCFGDTRYTTGSHSCGGRVLKLDEHALAENWESLKPSYLSPSLDAEDYPYLDININREEYMTESGSWQDNLSGSNPYVEVQPRKYVVWQEPQMQVSQIRVILNVKNNGYLRATDINKVGLARRYRVYTKTTSPTNALPRANSTFSGTRLFDLVFSYTYSNTLIPGQGWSDPQTDHYNQTGVTLDNLPSGVTFTSSQRTLVDQAGASHEVTRFEIYGLTINDISEDGVYGELLWVPEIMFTQPQFCIDLVTSNAAQYIHYSAGMSADWEVEYLTKMVGKYKYVLPAGPMPTDYHPPLRMNQRDDGVGSYEGHARITGCGVNTWSSANGPRIPGVSGTYR